MFDVGGGELILILLVVLLLFGPNKIPELSRQIGKGLRHFRKAQEDLTQQIRDISAEVAEPMTNIQSEVEQAFKVTQESQSVARNKPSGHRPEALGTEETTNSEEPPEHSTSKGQDETSSSL